MKLQINFIEITLRHGCSSVNLLYILRTPFRSNSSGWLVLEYTKIHMKILDICLHLFYAFYSSYLAGAGHGFYVLNVKLTKYLMEEVLKAFHQHGIAKQGSLIFVEYFPNI